jgi:hypothetical protein
MANTYNPNSVLEEIVVQDVEKLLAEQERITSLLRKGKPAKKVNSRGLRVPIDKDRNASIGQVNPRGGNFVKPDTTSYDHLTINWQMLQVGAEIEAESILNDGNASLVNSVDAAMTKKAEALADWIECFTCIGDGTPAIATVSAITTAGTVITCNGAADGFGAYWVRLRQTIRIYDATLTTLKYTTTVTAKTSNTEFTVADTVTVAVGDKICISGTTVSGIKGLPYICAPTGAYFDKNKSTEPYIRPNVDSAAAALDAQKMQRLWSKIKMRIGKHANDIMIAFPFSQEDAYYDIIRPEGATFAARTVYNYGGERPKGDVGLADMAFTWFGRPIKGFSGLLPNAGYYIPMGGFERTEIKPAGSIKGMPQGADLLPKINADGGYAYAVQSFSDVGMDNYASNPGKFGVMSALSITGLTLPKNSDAV